MEKLEEFRLYKSPAEALLDENRAAQMIPMKPIFYDLAYDLLKPPKLDFIKTLTKPSSPNSEPVVSSPNDEPAASSPSRGLLGGLWKR